MSEPTPEHQSDPSISADNKMEAGAMENDAAPTSDSAAVPEPIPEAKDSEAAASENLVSAMAASSNGRRIDWLGIRHEIPTWAKVIAGCLSVLTVIGMWWFVTRGEAEERIYGYMQLPSISETLEGLPDLLDSDRPEAHLFANTWVSLKRVAMGFLLATLVGIPVGVFAGCFPLIKSFFSPLVLFGRNIPIAALMPLMLALFGTGEGQKYAFIFVACVAFIVADTIDAIGEVGQRYIDTAKTLGASRFQIVRKVLVPLAMPMVFNSLRVLFGLAFGYIMLVEALKDHDGASGLGALVNISRRQSQPHYVIIVLLTIPLVAWMIDQLLFVVQCRLFKWKYGKEAQRSMLYRLSARAIRLFWNPKPAV